VVQRLSVSASQRVTVVNDRAGEAFVMALPSFMQHTEVLERAGIVTSHSTTF
jgi:hypothetical protein